MSDSIEVSPKHGVNPFIPACFWCGELKSEIALPGRIRNDPKTGEKVKGGDFEAKHGTIIDYVPCEKCKKNMELGVRMIEAWTLDQFTDHRPPIGKDNEGNDVIDGNLEIHIQSLGVEDQYWLDSGAFDF